MVLLPSESSVSSHIGSQSAIYYRAEKEKHSRLLKFLSLPWPQIYLAILHVIISLPSLIKMLLFWGGEALRVYIDGSGSLNCTLFVHLQIFWAFIHPNLFINITLDTQTSYNFVFLWHATALAATLMA